MADKYLLTLTAGSTYSPSTHTTLHPNTSHATTITSPYCTASIQTRIQSFRGLPRSCPSTSPYFSHPAHTHDQYSIDFTFVPHTSVSGADLMFGNDFDHPIRDRLPPGFSTAFRIAKWAVDPGLEGDPYAERPWLYSPLLATVNRLGVGGWAEKKRKGGGKGEGNVEGGGDGGYEVPVFKGERRGEDREVDVLEEGGEDGGEEVRKEKGTPETAADRKKWGLAEKEKWVWEEGRVYRGDFFNGYLDFNSFSLKLPGFSLPVLGYVGGEDSLRYVLKNKKTGDVFFVVVITLRLREDVKREEAEEEERKQGESVEKGAKDDGRSKEFEPGADDLD